MSLKKGDKFTRSGIEFIVIKNDNGTVHATTTKSQGEYQRAECNEKANVFYKKVEGCDYSRLFIKEEVIHYDHHDWYDGIGVYGITKEDRKTGYNWWLFTRNTGTGGGHFTVSKDGVHVSYGYDSIPRGLRPLCLFHY